MKYVVFLLCATLGLCWLGCTVNKSKPVVTFVDSLAVPAVQPLKQRLHVADLYVAFRDTQNVTDKNFPDDWPKGNYTCGVAVFAFDGEMYPYAIRDTLNQHGYVPATLRELVTFYQKHKGELPEGMLLVAMGSEPQVVLSGMQVGLKSGYPFIRIGMRVVAVNWGTKHSWGGGCSFLGVRHPQYMH